MILFALRMSTQNLQMPSSTQVWSFCVNSCKYSSLYTSSERTFKQCTLNNGYITSQQHKFEYWKNSLHPYWTNKYIHQCSLMITYQCQRSLCNMSGNIYTKSSSKATRHINQHLKSSICVFPKYESTFTGSKIISSEKFSNGNTHLVAENKKNACNADFNDETTPPQRFVNRCPSAVQPYLRLMRLDRPVGTWLLFWPCGWSLALAQSPGSLPDPTLLAVFAIGSLVMRGAGCTLNDLWDRDIDAKVARTRQRPLASGAVRPLEAVVFLGAQLGVGLLVLLQLSAPAVLLGAASMGLVCIYPLVKRVSYWPQLVLGLTFNWGALLGWCAVHGTVSALPVLPLYAAGVFWTLIYDTIYAHQDKEDDIKIGVKSTALRFGESTGVWTAGFSCAMVSCLLLTGATGNMAWPYYAAVGATALNLAYQVRTLDIHSPERCGRQFRQNRHLGLLLFLGLAAGRVLSDDAPAGTVDDSVTADDGRVVLA